LSWRGPFKGVELMMMMMMMMRYGLRWNMSVGESDDSRTGANMAMRLDPARNRRIILEDIDSCATGAGILSLGTDSKGDPGEELSGAVPVCSTAIS
jgi:hypothetical protein